MAYFLDERIRETVTFTSATVATLGGAVDNHRRFRDALRRDGNAVQSGDRCPVGILQAGVGFANCVAQLTLGAQDTLTLQNGAGKIYQSSAWPALPTFSSSGAAGEAYIAPAAPLLAQFDEDGGLLDPDLFRKAIVFEKLVSGFLAELGTVDLEGVVGLGVDNAFDGLAGAFAMDIDDATTEDGVDVFENENSATGRILRADMKPWRTWGPTTLANGNATTVLNANVADRSWLVIAKAVGAAARCAAVVQGHASDPQVDVLHEYGGLAFELSTTNLQVRNATGAPVSLRWTRGVL